MGPKTYVVTGMAFSPDSSRLAIAQSDNIVFVYKLGTEWTGEQWVGARNEAVTDPASCADKKSICNKFALTGSATTLCWPTGRHGDFVTGSLDGKVLLCNLKTNKSVQLYSVGSMVVSTAASSDGSTFLTGHGDGSVYRYQFEQEGVAAVYSRFFSHSCAPVCLAWGESIVCAGSDARVTFYDDGGSPERTFEFEDEGGKAFSSIAISPGGDTAVLGAFDEFRTFSRAPKSGEWSESSRNHVPHLYTVTSLAWKSDGSRVALGSLCGVVDLYDACLKRVMYKDRFEFTHVSPSQVIVKRLATGTRIVLRSLFHCEIGKIAVYRDRFLVAHTPETIMVGDLETCKLSEVAWRGGAQGSGERFLFDHPTVCAVFRAGELTLIEYGKDEVLGQCFTEHVTGHLLSIRVNERPPAPEDPASSLIAETDPETEEAAFVNKKVAFLLDEQTVRVLDFGTGSVVATVSHDARIDWLELNARGNLLLFRDRRRRLMLHQIFSGRSSTLLSQCSYVQWVPDSDVVVAQSRLSLCVWYNIDAPDKVTSYDIKGDVEDIERVDGHTEVVVDEGLNTASYLLDEGLIAFSTALDDRDYDGAMDILEGLEMTSETEAMWRRLGEASLLAGSLLIAQRCAAAVGDVARARYLHKTAKLSKLAKERLGTDGNDFWMVRARLAQLRAEFADAEAIFMDAGKPEEAVIMYQTLHRFEDAIAVAESRGRADTESMRAEYLEFLLSSGQEDKAAEIKEQEGRFEEAMELYLRGGYPARAAAVVSSRPMSFPAETIERVATSLQTAGLSGKAGALYERTGDNRKALECYVRGKTFREAVELARHAFPAQVTKLEHAWGTHLAANKQLDQAINHFIEAGSHKEAIDAALRARQFSKAAQLIADMQRDASEAAPWYLELARQYRAAGRLAEAEKAYVQAGDATSAVGMYVEAGRWDAALRLANASMSEEDVVALFTREGKRLAGEGQLRQAERVLVMVGQHDLAITMYKRSKEYDAMVRLVAQFHKDLLAQTHQHIAKQLEKEGDHARAERHYVDGGQWKAAVTMHRAGGRLADARRVAKTHGGSEAWQREALSQALEMGGEAGKNMLRELGLVVRAIDYCCEIKDWDGARELARRHAPEKMETITYKRALQLEDDSRFDEAEAEFVAAGRPREAVEMHLHQKNWEAAMKVAESHDQAAVSRVLIARANAEMADGALDAALRHFLDAKRPELAVEAFISAKLFAEAMKTAKIHLPRDKAAEYQRRIKRLISGGGEDGGDFADPDEVRGGGRPRTGEAASAGEEASASSGLGGKRGKDTENHLENARLFEASQDYALAVTEYLRVTEADAPSRAARENAWIRAVQLAASHDERRYMEVAVVAAKLMTSIESWEKAGDLFASASLPREAVEAYLKAQKFKKALSAAKEAGDPKLSSKVADAERAFNEGSGDVHALERGGHLRSAVQVLLTQGKWESALDRIAKAGDRELLEEVAPRRVEQLLEDGQPAQAVALLATYGAPSADGLAEMYMRLAQAVFQGPRPKACPPNVVASLRDVLFKVVGARKAAGAEGKGDSAVLDRVLMAAHYSAMRDAAVVAGDHVLAAEVSVSLLRYCGVVPADRAFLEAGEAMKQARRLNVAFVMLNRFLDLAEAIEEGDASAIDNTDFEGTEIPSPLDFPLPTSLFLDSAQLEEVRQWVLSVSMDGSVEQTLKPGDIPSADRSALPKCVISGTPVPPSDRVACTACGSVALKKHWNALVGKSGTCPWCAATQAPVY
jgi:intraflagellar transport protein 172